MGVELNGIAHIQLTVTDASCIPFWEQLCHFLEMRTLIKSDDIVYCIGSRTGILVRADPEARSRGPGKGHFGAEGRLGPGGEGPADRYGEGGLTGSRRRGG